MQIALPTVFAPFAALLRSRPTAARVPRNLPTATALQAVEAGTTLVVPQPGGRRIECLRGCVWLTQDNDPRDVVLEAGQSYIANGDARLLAYGLEASDLRIA